MEIPPFFVSTVDHEKSTTYTYHDYKLKHFTGHHLPKKYTMENTP